ncbi:MAG: hypothetical protein ACRDQW_06565, partial [Haloechinothrix sp.]
SHTTPRPGGGGGPEATAIADGLPVTVAAGESAPFDVRGTYELVSTDEGDKATLHLRAFGTGPFSIGINVHLRAEGTTEGGMTPALPRPGHHGCHGFRRGVAPGPGVGG